MAKQEFKAGDKIVFGRSKRNKGADGVIIGKVYTVCYDNDWGLHFIDSEGEPNHLGINTDDYFKPTKVVEWTGAAQATDGPAEGGQKLKAGDQAIFARCKRNTGMLDITVGKIYSIFQSEFDGERLAFRDDAGDYRQDALVTHKPTKIIE
jgi:hypothetical protein